MLKLALALTFCLAAADAQARASGIAQGGWSKLSAAQMQRLPGAVRLALHHAQAGCGAEAIRVRNGFLTYLPLPDGRQLITIHFEHVECDNGKLCAPAGCLHRVLFSSADGKFSAISGGETFAKSTRRSSLAVFVSESIAAKEAAVAAAI